MPLEDLVKQVAVSFERDGRVQAVFGQPIELKHHTVVPVAVITEGVAGGGTRGAFYGAVAGGMGVGLNIQPVGFISESGDEVVFTPIHLDGRRQPLWAEAAFGMRRAIDLAHSVITQWMQRPGSKKPVPAPAVTDSRN